MTEHSVLRAQQRDVQLGEALLGRHDAADVGELLELRAALGQRLPGAALDGGLAAELGQPPAVLADAADAVGYALDRAVRGGLQEGVVELGELVDERRERLR